MLGLSFQFIPLAHGKLPHAAVKYFAQTHEAFLTHSVRQMTALMQTKAFICLGRLVMDSRVRRLSLLFSKQLAFDSFWMKLGRRLVLMTKCGNKK